ncbi:MAG: AsmA family protein [Verrucomicrobiota bacterium]
MKKIKRILIVSATGLIALLLIAAIVIGLSLDRLVKAGIETIAPTLTKTTVTLDAVNLSLLTGSAGVKGLVVGNPSGYQSPSAISIDLAAVSVSPASVLSDKILVHSIEIRAPEITFEGNPFGANNLSQILDNVNGSAKTNNPTQTASGKPVKKLEVDDFLIAGAKVHVKLTGILNKELDLTLPDIHFTDLGKDTDGITAVDLTQKVLQQVITATVKAVGDDAEHLSGDSLGTGLNKIKGGLGGILGK